MAGERVPGTRQITIVAMPGHPAWNAQAAATAGYAEPATRTKSRTGTALIAGILLGSAFLQFYRLNDLQHFQGDEGSLVLAARALIVQHIFPVYGLKLDVGGAHIGPLFDYLIALPLWLAGLNPTAAVALNGSSQVLAVFLCYQLLVHCRAGQIAGLVAAGSYAAAQEVVYYARFLWPNLLPCLVVLMFWSMLRLQEGARQHLALLAIWLAVALQMQPTAVLLVPFLGVWLVLARPPLSAAAAALGAAAFALLFLPSIVHDVTHGLEETRAWLHYSSGGTPQDRTISHTLARLGVLLQRLLGIRQSLLAAMLGIALTLGTVLRAALGRGSGGPSTDGAASRSPSDLARLLVLLSLCCLAGYLFFGSQLRPHYLMPLFPVPALALGLLAAACGPRGRPWQAVWATGRGAVVAIALVLAASNVQHTWQASFLLDRYQITLAPEQSNLITLQQMRELTTAIVQTAQGRRFNLLFAAPDDQPYAYQALLLGAGARLSFHSAPLRFLIVQPPDWRQAHWPSWVRVLAACAPSPHRFAAALVWTVSSTSLSRSPPHATPSRGSPKRCQEGG